MTDLVTKVEVGFLNFSSFFVFRFAHHHSSQTTTVYDQDAADAADAAHQPSPQHITMCVRDITCRIMS
jgi:hypothetical protein